MTSIRFYCGKTAIIYTHHTYLYNLQAKKLTPIKYMNIFRELLNTIV